MPSRRRAVKVVAYTTLSVKRVHMRTCDSYGSEDDCPSRSKKKCPFWLVGYGRGPDGKLVRVRQSLKVTNQKIATEKMNALLLGESAAVENAPSGVSVDEAVDRFFAEQKARHMSVPTIKAFRKLLKSTTERDLTKVSPTLVIYARNAGLKYITDFTPDHVSAFRQQWRVSTITALKQTERLKSFFRQCADMGWTTTNPAAKLKPPVVNENDDVPVIPFRREEEQRIFAALANDERLLLFNKVMRYSGLAISDTVQLRPERLAGDHLKLRRTKTNAWVKVLLPPTIAERLRQLPTYAAGYWFWNRQTESKHETATGNMRRKLRWVFGPDGANIQLRDDEGRPITNREGKQQYGHPHMWRHTFVKALIQAGVSIPTIADLIGDDPETVAKHYKAFIAENQHSLDEAARKAW